MKITRFAAFAIALLLASPALAQWQTPNHSVPLGRGSGVSGFGAAAPSTAGRPLISNGASSDPSFGLVPNSALTPGAADTLKGSLNGTTVTDVAVPACTSVGSALQWAAGTGPQCNPVSVFTGFDAPVNMGLSAAVAGNALTFTLTTASGGVPSTTSPVLVPFRSTTLTTGTATWRTITSTRTLTVPSGATLGASSSSVSFRLWLFLEDNGGTPELAVAMCSTATTIYPCASWENTLKTSIAIDTASDNAGVLYAPTAVTSDAVRIVGFCDYAGGLATAGTWASSCTALQLMGPGIKKPGDIVQSVYTSITGGSTTTNTYSNSNTAPVAANGATPGNVAITPTAAANLIRVSAELVLNNSGSANGMSAWIMNGATTLVTTQLGGVSLSFANNLLLSYQNVALGTSAITYTLYGGANAGTTTFNGIGGAAQWGSTAASFIRAEEIMGALPEPANDNLHPGIFSKTG